MRGEYRPASSLNERGMKLSAIPMGTSSVLVSHEVQHRGKNSTYPSMVSFWKPSPEELRWLMAGQPIVLSVFKDEMPSVAVFVEPLK